jgi:hypothetical protein
MNGPGDERCGAVFALALATMCALAAGCDKKDEGSAPGLAPSASSLAPSVAAPAADGMKALKLTIDPASATTIDMPAPIEHIKADTSAAAGTLEVDLTNLSNSRGEVKIDLSTLKMHTFDDSARNDAEGRDAKTWLEVNPMDAGPSADQAAANRWVLFAIRSIDGLSAPDVTKVTPTKDGTDDVREVTMTAHGDLLLHGRKVSKDAPLVARFHYASGAAPTSKPTRVDIATKSPLHVALDEHDVKPRDPAGAIKLAAAGLLGTKVAKIADITLDLHATVAP